MRAKKNAELAAFFQMTNLTHEKKPRLASRSKTGCSSRCHNQGAFLALKENIALFVKKFWWAVRNSNPRPLGCRPSILTS